MRRLEKAESRQRRQELRDLWNKYDPIGVIDGPESPIDEYESYIGPCMRLLEQNADIKQIEAQVRAALENMGLGDDDARIHLFASQMKKWFQAHWDNTES